MLLDLRLKRTPRATLPDGFSWVQWDNSVLLKHAAVKYACFREEPDAAIFRSLQSAEGCRRLLHDIARHRGFLPGTTWMIRRSSGEFGPATMCGTIQGIRNDSQQGAIQNVGILPGFRGLGLGRALLLKSLSGFRLEGLTRVYLEVTATNHAALALYQSVGFEIVDMRYRPVVGEHVGTGSHNVRDEAVVVQPR
ncbi:MAG: GNAT family N-acetyltransferase [Planctomycetaceae bacterium]|nr:GNAT family N-acetyltransferase [Planctomycetaceae bacterium]MCB9950308.1 GNAT family N-acetyltransferase [Planctomycetaceae bacterium]